MLRPRQTTCLLCLHLTPATPTPSHPRQLQGPISTVTPEAALSAPMTRRVDVLAASLMLHHQDLICTAGSLAVAQPPQLAHQVRLLEDPTCVAGTQARVLPAATTVELVVAVAARCKTLQCGRALVTSQVLRRRGQICIGGTLATGQSVAALIERRLAAAHSVKTQRGVQICTPGTPAAVPTVPATAALHLRHLQTTPVSAACPVVRLSRPHTASQIMCVRLVVECARATVRVKALRS